jgi:hypothetical protein
MSDPVTDLNEVMRAINMAKANAQGVAREVHLHPDTIRKISEATGTVTFTGPSGQVGRFEGIITGLPVIADDAVDPGEAFVISDSAWPVRSPAVQLPYNDNLADLFMGRGEKRSNSETFNPLGECVQRLEMLQNPERPQCKECLGYDISWSVDRQLDGPTTYNAACRDCDMSETYEVNASGAGKRTVSGGSRETKGCDRCGVVMRTTMLKRVAHRSRDEVTTMLDLCEGCSQLTLCVASHSGVHEHVIPYDSPNHVMPKGAVHPLPEEERGGWCLSCHTSMYWVWTFGCTGAWVELTWAMLAEMWENQ